MNKEQFKRADQIKRDLDFLKNYQIDIERILSRTIYNSKTGFYEFVFTNDELQNIFSIVGEIIKKKITALENEFEGL